MNSTVEGGTSTKSKTVKQETVMNTQIAINTKAQLEDTKFSVLALIYNEFAAELGIKQIKKFRDKSTGVARVLQIQEQYVEERDEFLAQHKVKAEEKVEKVRKAVQSETLAAEYELSTKSNGYAPKEGSINEFILNLVKAEQPIKGQDIIDRIVSEFKRPRGTAVTVGFAKTSLNWLVRNDYIKQA